MYRKGDVADGVEIGVLVDIGIDEEGHRHLDGLAGLQRLLGEAEALDLVEVDAGALGRDVEDRPVPVIGLVREVARR